MAEPVAAAEAPPLRFGSEAHKEAFCRMLLDTHDPYRPAAIDWPTLDAAARERLVGLPIWDLAIRTEGFAAIRVGSFAETLRDPVLREAMRLDAFEERRHKELLGHMIAAYGIAVEPEPDYPAPREPEWAFVRTGFSECIDSFFAFGLFALARRAGFVPEALCALFEPVIQEECRHILFFKNWLVWRQRNTPWWRKPWFHARCLMVLAAIARDRARLGRSIGAGRRTAPSDGPGVTMTTHRHLGGHIGFGEVIAFSLAENDRRMARYDPRLARPRLVPLVVRLVRPLLGTRRDGEAAAA